MSLGAVHKKQPDTDRHGRETFDIHFSFVNGSSSQAENHEEENEVKGLIFSKSGTSKILTA